MEKWVYVVRDFYGKEELELEAKSSIDAARIFLKRKDVKRYTMNDKCIRNWSCIVYKYNTLDKKETRISYSVNYYGLIF